MSDQIGIGEIINSTVINHMKYGNSICTVLGYEPAGFIVHPPPQKKKRSRVGLFFRIGD